MQKDRPLTVRQAAEALSLSAHTIRAWLSRRKLAYVRLGRAIRVPASEIERLLDEGTVPVRKKRDGRQ